MEFFDFERFVSQRSPDDVARFDTKLGQLAEAGRYREAVNHFLATVPVFAPGLYDENYFRAELSYLRALLSAARGDAGAAAAKMDSAEVDLAGDWNDLLFSSHTNRAVQIYERQEQAIAAGKPSILITALPKSGSAFLSSTLAEALEIPMVRASVGTFPIMGVVPRWIRQIAQGGCVTHDHFDGSANNLIPILQNGISRVFVQVRDPRAALWSDLHFERKMAADDALARDLDALIDAFYVPAIAWLESWIEAAAALSGRVGVHFVEYQSVSAQPDAVCGAILQLSGAERFIPELTAFIANSRGGAEVAPNFRSGTSTEWRNDMPETTQQRLWDLTSPLVRERMALEP